MKKMFLTGRSEAGKTSLTQALKGEDLHYVKTQYTNTNDEMIDSPGEYAESKHFSVGLACFSFEADVVALVQAAGRTIQSVWLQLPDVYSPPADWYYYKNRFSLRQHPDGPSMADQCRLSSYFSCQQ